MNCQNPATAYQKELERAHQEIDILKLELEKKNDHKSLIHTVYFRLKEDQKSTNLALFEKALNSLSSIDGVHNLEVGQPAETGDKRLISNYDFVLIMEFESIEDLKKYSVDSFHLSVREKVGPLLKKAPVVYDYWIK